MLKIESKEKTVNRAYSIASPPPADGKIELTIKKVEGGIGSTFLHNLNIGEEIQMTGPLGHFIPKEDKDLVFISTGCGLPPFRCCIHHLLNKGFEKKIILLRGFRYECESMYDNELKQLQEQHKNLKVHTIISRPEKEDYNGDKGHVQELLNKYVSIDIDANYYICGLLPMIESVTKLLEERGVPKEQIYFERFS